METEKTKNAPDSIYMPATKLWIVDCLRISPHPAVESAYLFQDFVVHYVDVFGVVSARKLIGASGAVYTIDDGTGEILCLFDCARRDIEEDYQKIQGITSELENISGFTEKEHKLLKYMMKPAINTFENLVKFREIGDTVHVVGRLCQYRESRQVKAYQMRLLTDLNDEVDRIHELVLLYENGYSKSKG